MGWWDELAPVARGSGALGAIEDLLRSIDVNAQVEDRDGPPPTRRLTAVWTPGGGEVVRFDPGAGRFTTDPAASGGTASPIEFPDPRFEVRLDLDLPAPGAEPHGPFTLELTVPRAYVRIPGLRGAKLDALGMLVEDPDQPTVRFTLPRIRIRVRWDGPGTSASAEVVSAATGAPGAADPGAAEPGAAGAGDPADLYEFVRMEPAHALIGPGEVVGFAFRTAVLDLSGETTPSGSPALGAPGEWQGLWLPEARLFVAPDGLDGFAVSGGVRDLWIGFGAHAGVTGLFELEVANRGAAPTVRLRFQDAEGRWFGVDGDTVALPERTTVFADSNGFAPVALRLTVGGATTDADRAGVTTPAAGGVTVTATATDAQGRTGTATVVATRRATPLPPTAGSGAQDVRIQAGSATGSAASRIVVRSQTATHAVVALEPADGSVTWSWPGGSASGPTAEVPVASRASATTVAVTATRTRSGGSPSTIDGYFLVNRPRVMDDAAAYAYSTNPANTRTAPARTDGSGFTDGAAFLGQPLTDRLAQLPAGTTIRVDGYASYDGNGNDPVNNQGLSERRRAALVHLLAGRAPAGVTVTPGAADGDQAHRAASGQPRNRWWRATATVTPPTDVTETVGVTLVRDAQTPATPGTTVVDPAPTERPVPSWFRKLGARVELVRGTFVRAEVYGEIDLQTAAENQLGDSAGGVPPRTNPADGISRFLVRLRIAEDRSRWDLTAEFRAVEEDADGLAQWRRTADSTALDILGALAIFAPLLAVATPPSPREGELVALAFASGGVVALGAAGVVKTQKLTLRGAELAVADGPEGTSVTVLLDVETAFSADLLLLEIPDDRPVTTRYQAVGLRTRWNTPDTGDVEFVPTWAFDPSRGYSLDVPAGALVAVDPLGDLLRPLGFRISRDNPTFLELEVGIGADLGVVNVDSVRVRVRVDAPEPPQLTAFGASVDIPGALRGSGYLSLPPGGGVEGAIDLTIEPINVRVAGALKIETKDGVTGVFVGLEVHFPVPILLGNSGLGIFGVLGGVGVNMKRLEQTNVPVPALRWLEAQMARPLGVLAPQGWGAQPSAFAFAAGILLGTVDGGFVVHLKGIVILELPGPRLLLVMKADVLKMPPSLVGEQTATFLAVIDLDVARGTITIGIVAQYDVAQLISIRVPVTAFFDANKPTDWFVELGNFTERVVVRVFELFEGNGYLMVHGKAIDHPRFPDVVTSGLTIATGFHLQFVWGSTSIGLYLKVAGGFDAIVSFSPFALGGIIELSGELRLFIVSIGASAELRVLSGRGRIGGVEVERTHIRGEVCGKVDFFFFSVKGCVTFELGDPGIPDPEPPPLVAGVSLVSRSPALVEGSGSDRPIDGTLGEAREVRADGTTPLDPASVAPDPVPLDVVPVVQFDVPATVAGVSFKGKLLSTSNGSTSNPWIRRGRRWWRYEVQAVDLVGELTDGPTPATWWSRGNPGDPQAGPSLALLSWVPDAHPRAVPFGEELRKRVTREWGTVCTPVAKPAPVLWTFLDQPDGPSPDGWTLRGTAWPDDAGTTRGTPVRARLQVTERWRCGDAAADVLRGIDPARVVGDAVPCLPLQPGTHGRNIHGRDTHVHGFASDGETAAGQALGPSRVAGPQTMADLVTVAADAPAGTTPASLRAAFVHDAWDPPTVGLGGGAGGAGGGWAGGGGGIGGGGDGGRGGGCTGKLLRSPEHDGPDPIRAGDPDDEEAVRLAWQQQKFTPDDLLDTVRLHHDDGFEEAAILLLVPSRLTGDRLVLRLRDASGAVVDERRLSASHELNGGAAVPTRWLDPDGPWAPLVQRVAQYAGRLVATTSTPLGPLVACLVPLDGLRGVTTIDLGWAADLDEQFRKLGGLPAFYVAAVEGLGGAEVVRSDWETVDVEERREALTALAEQAPDDHALLRPGRSYRVEVRWRAASVELDTLPGVDHQPTWGAPQTQRFVFASEPTSNVPARLDPWVVASAPAAEETAVFCDEPLRVVFAHGAVDRLFAAYGTELRLRVRSASGRHPRAEGQGDVLPIILLLEDLPRLATPLLTPFEDMLAELTRVGELPCVPDVGRRVDQRVFGRRFELEPLTDYLLDVVRVPVGASASAEGTVVFRAGFTTSRFADVAELAHLVRQAVVEHRYVPDAAPLTALLPTARGEVLDDAFTRAGLGAPEVPRYPRVQVLWSEPSAGATPVALPQPVAVVVESNEPLWRSRPAPTRITVPDGAAQPERAWWATTDTPWLSLQVASVLPAPGDPPLAGVARTVRGPGGTRAVFLLEPGSRGRQLRLRLTRHGDPLLGSADEHVDALQVRLLAAPWEDED